jgi:hypothetical protein
MPTISTYVRIDIDEVLSEIDDDDLIEELRSRGKETAQPLGCDESDAHRALEHLMRGEPDEAQLILERALLPKFRHMADTMKKIAELRAAQ